MTRPTEATDLVLACPFCFGLINDPVAMPCAHRACFRCAAAALSTRQGEGVACPLCHAVWAIQSPAEAEGARDKATAAKIDGLRSPADVRPRCQWCAAAPATHVCDACSAAHCAECSEAVHRQVVKRSHTPRPLTSTSDTRSIVPKCGERGHEEYRQDFFCTPCAMLCCAYCLQVGPHKGHASQTVAAAATAARKGAAMEGQAVSQMRAQIDAAVHELQGIVAKYDDSYDRVESLVTDRFETLRAQITEKEVSVRRELAALRDSGDSTIASVRMAIVRRCSDLLFASLTVERLQRDSSDVEVLLAPATSSLALHRAANPLPRLQGGTFSVSDDGVTAVGNFALRLDLTQRDAPAPSKNETAEAPPGSVAAPTSTPPLVPARSRSDAAAPTTLLSTSRSSSARLHASLTFNRDDDIRTTERLDGMSMKCSRSAAAPQIGLRANESLDDLCRASGGVAEWRLRLDDVVDAFVGVVEGGARQSPDGLYWRPMRSQVDGSAGRFTRTLLSLTPCRPGDVLRFSYDAANRTLSLHINNRDCGVIANDVSPLLCPCIIFPPGEAITLMK